MLTPEEKQSYDENGFILKKALASPEEIEKIREEIQKHSQSHGGATG